jgi:autotransporter-associated beta strand protein
MYLLTNISAKSARSTCRARVWRGVGGWVALIVLLSANFAQAQTLYWDLNVNAAGTGSSTPSATWSTSGSDKNWSTSSAGTSGGGLKWTDGYDAVFSAGTDATGSYTVTVSGTRNVSSITVEDGSPTFTGGTLNFSDSSPDFVVASGLTATASSVISGTNGLTKSGDGLLVFNGSTKTYTGPTTVTAGTLRLDSSNIIVSTTALSVGASGTFELNWGVSQTIGSLAGAGSVNIRSNTLTVGDSTSTTFTGVLSDSGSYGTLVKQGTGSLTLSGANTYTGPTTINAGAIVVANSSALGTSTYGNTVASGAALQFQGGVTLTEGQFSVTGAGVGGTGALRNLSGTNTLAAAIDLAGSTTVAADAGTLTVAGQVNLGSGNTLTVAGAGNVTFSDAINNSSNIAQTGTGTLTFSGANANSFGGTLAINSGTVLFNKTAGTNAYTGSGLTVGDGVGASGSAILRLGASNQIADYAGSLTINADGLFDLNNNSEAVNVIAGTGQIALGSSGSLTVGINSGSSSFGGTITGTGTLIKAGSGTLALQSALVLSGELQLNGGTLALSGYNLTVATLHITGNSTIDFAGTNSTLSATTFIIDAGVTLSIMNWTNAADYFFAQNWSGADEPGDFLRFHREPDRVADLRPADHARAGARGLRGTAHGRTLGLGRPTTLFPHQAAGLNPRRASVSAELRWACYNLISWGESSLVVGT